MAACFWLAGLLAPALLQAQEYKWGNVNIGGGGFVSALITSKNEEGLLYARTDVGGAYRWDPENGNWIPLNDWVGEDQTGYLGIESLAIDPQEPNKLYMLVGISYFNGGKTAILRSDDYGQTFSITEVSSQFKAHGNGMGRQNGEKLVVDANQPNILFTGTRWDGLFKSSDSGESWSRVEALDVTTTPNENGISFVVLDSLSSEYGTPTQSLFVGVSRTGDNLYRSDDGGETFSLISGGPTELMPQRAVLDGAGNLYITYANGAGPHPHWAVPEPMDAGKIMKYNTETGEWTDVTPQGMGSAFGGISIDPENSQRIIASTINLWWTQGDGNGDRFFLSTDGGESWTDVIERGFEEDDNGYDWIHGQSIHWAGSIEFDPFNTDRVWVTSGNGVYSTENIDATPAVWKFNVEGLEETVPLNMVSIPDGPVVSVIGDYDGFIHEDITQPGKTHKPGMGTTTGLAYAAQNPDVLLRYGNKMYYSLDGGESWIKATNKGEKGQVAISADGEIFLHTPEHSNVTFRSEDRGASWTAVSGLGIKDARVVADPVNTDKFYAYSPGSGKMYVSEDKGVSFSEAGQTGNNGSKIIRTVIGHEGHLWVALNSGGLARSTDSGESFSRLEEVSHAAAVGLGKQAANSDYPTIYIWGTVDNVLGLHMSTDSGESWTRINDDAHEFGGPGNGQFVVGDWNVFGRVYMSTAGRGIVYGEPNCSFSTVQPFVQLEGEEKQATQHLIMEEGATLTLMPEATEGGSWSWTGPNGFSSESREVKLENIGTEEEGTYTVSYLNAEGCASPALRFTLALETTTGITDRSRVGKLRVFPNPSDGSMRLHIPGPGFYQLMISDLNGRTVFRKELERSAEQLHIRSGLKPGIYFIQVKSPEKLLTSRIIIK